MVSDSTSPGPPTAASRGRTSPIRNCASHGGALLVNPDPARRTLEAWAEVGIGHRRAADLTGIACSTVQRIRHGESARICERVAHAILDVTRPSLAHGQRVNGYRTRYLLACLRTEGLSQRWIAARLGLHRGHLWTQSGPVTVETALRVRALYQDVCEVDSTPVA